MPGIAEDNSFAAIVEALKAAPGGARVIDRALAANYTRFVEILREDIDDIISGMERNRQRFQNRSEDEITFHVASMLKQLGYTAQNGTQFGGSVDLTVEKVVKGWLWTAEAKIYTSLEKVYEGFLQLTTRYSPGNIEEAQAGMLIYILAGDAAKKVKVWRDHLSSCKSPTVTTEDSSVRPSMYFFSSMLHQSTALPLNVRHMGVALHFKPMDKSGRNAAKYKSTS